jgi:uncharacterized protein (DUF885 family)
LEHHEELLKAIGFESNGVNMEWKWHTGNNSNSQEEQEENLAILKAMLKALQSLSIMESTSSLADIMREQVDAYKAVIEEKPSVSTDAITTTDTTTSSTTNSTPSVEFPCKQSSDLDSFMAKLEQKAAAVNASPNRMNSPVLSSVERPTFLLEEEKEEVKESVGDGPSYPKSFTEVMQMIQRGEQVPGIQEIEDKLSEDSSLFLTQESIGSVEALGEVGEQIVGAGTKPWERTTS